MKLYEINEKIKNCIRYDENTAVDTETGEMIDIEALDNLVMEREEKVLNIARWVKELSAEAEAVKAEKLKLGKRQQSLENKVDSLKEYLTKIVTEGEVIKDATSVVKWRKSEVTEVDMKAFLDWEHADDYLTFAEPKVNKADIKKAIKGGALIPGCEVVAKNNLQIG